MVFSMRVSAQSLHNSFACSSTVNVGQGRKDLVWLPILKRRTGSMGSNSSPNKQIREESCWILQ